MFTTQERDVEQNYFARENTGAKVTDPKKFVGCNRDENIGFRNHNLPVTFSGTYR
jgi:hypothetical protein